MCRVAILVSSKLDNRAPRLSAREENPQRDYFALADALDATIIHHEKAVQQAWRGRSKTALWPAMSQAWHAFQRRHEYDCIVTDSEHVGIPLALLFKMAGARVGHVMIGHRLSPTKKVLAFRALRVQTHIDKLICYSPGQRDRAISRLRIPPEKVELAFLAVDHRFWHPLPIQKERLICSAGLEFRDYPTLLEAIKDVDVRLTIAAASPWSRRSNETGDRQLPQNVTMASDAQTKLTYAQLRELYARSLFFVIPLYENDFGAGLNVMCEAMAMGKAIVTTKTTGQGDMLQEGVTGWYVPAGDAHALRRAILRLLDNHQEAEEMGRAARKVVEARLSLDAFATNVARIVRQVTEPLAARSAGEQDTAIESPSRRS